MSVDVFKHSILPNDFVVTRVEITTNKQQVIPSGTLLRAAIVSESHVSIRFQNETVCIPAYQVELRKGK